MRVLPAAILALLGAACLAPAGPTAPAAPTAEPASALPAADEATITPWPAPPAVPGAPPGRAVIDAMARLVERGGAGGVADRAALSILAGSGDPRFAWLLADLLRTTVTPDAEAALLDAFATLTGTDAREERFGPNPWLAVSNLLIGWDLSAPPGYAEAKSDLLRELEPAWEHLLSDANGTLDLRIVTWGGVFMDDRPPGSDAPCHRACIPALEDPALTDAADGAWYPDDGTVFGITLNGESVALPRHMMEVHELVSLTLGGRRIGIPYCSLCASAQAFLVDDVPGTDRPLVLRTSGLLSRSNKVAVDFVTGSAFHSFTGRAATGPLRDAGVKLEAVNVSVATWGDWKSAHPNTRIVARDGGIGRTYPGDPLCGRDDAGPIFPTGPVDARLPAQAAVIGVIDSAGEPVAFAVLSARAALETGQPVRYDGVELHDDLGVLRAWDRDGVELPTQQAFWFAWSQFHPSTSLWAPASAGNVEHGAPGGRRVSPEGCAEVVDPLDR